MHYDLTVSVHKGTCSSAHIGHNKRTINVPHSDKNRKDLNVSYIDMTLKEAYHKLFDDALAEYNKDKKPSRQIKDYLEHIISQYEKGEKRLQLARSSGSSRKELSRIKSSYPKPFYEIIVSIGNRNSYNGEFRNGGRNEQIAVDILNEYMKDFQERNPHLFVFSAHLHRDEMEGVPHIHLDYIPWTDEPGRGLPIRVSENGAFKQQGLTSGRKGDIGSVAFQEKERSVISQISKKYDINIIYGKHSKNHLSKEQYILEKEQNQVRNDYFLVESQAGELLKYQDEFSCFLMKQNQKNDFCEYLEYKKLKEKENIFENEKEKNKRIISDAWIEFNDDTSYFFTEYRKRKLLLKNEIKQAKFNYSENKKKIESLLWDISKQNDWFIMKLLKLLMVIFIIRDTKFCEKELTRLYDANNKIKSEAKELFQQSNNISSILKNKNIDDIEIALNNYETNLTSVLNYIDKTVEPISDFNLDEGTR